MSLNFNIIGIGVFDGWIKLFGKMSIELVTHIHFLNILFYAHTCVVNSQNQILGTCCVMYKLYTVHKYRHIIFILYVYVYKLHNFWTYMIIC